MSEGSVDLCAVLGHENVLAQYRCVLICKNVAREADKEQGWRPQVQAPALRRESWRREAGEVAALLCLAWCAHEPIRLHSCSKVHDP